MAETMATYDSLNPATVTVAAPLRSGTAGRYRDSDVRTGEPGVVLGLLRLLFAAAFAGAVFAVVAGGVLLWLIHR